MMNRLQSKGAKNKEIGRLKQEEAAKTGDRFERIEGKEEELVGKLQEKMGNEDEILDAIDEADDEVDEDDA